MQTRKPDNRSITSMCRSSISWKRGRGEEKRTMEKRNATAIILSALLCFLLILTGKLKDSFEFSQTYMLLFLCIKNVLEKNQ